MNDASAPTDTSDLAPHTRTLLITPDLDAAAPLLAVLSDVRICSPDELAAGIDEVVDSADLAVVAGVPAERGRLTAVIRALTDSGRARVGLNLSDAPGRAVREHPDLLRGFAVRDTVAVGSSTVVVLERAASADDVPDFIGTAIDVADGGAVDAETERLALRIRVEAMQDEIDRLREQHASDDESLSELRDELDRTTDQRDKLDLDLRALRNTLFGKLARLEQPATTKAAASKRRRVLSVLAAGAFVAVIGFAVLMGFATSTGYVGGLLTALCLVLLAALAFVVLRVRRIAIGITSNTRLTQSGFRDLGLELQEQAATIDQLVRTSKALAHKLDVLTATATDLATERKADRAALSDLLRAETTVAVRQVQALLNIFELVGTRDVLPFMGAWAASPDVVALLVEELLRARPGLVVECGSGASTVVLALTAERLGLDTRVVALEHDEAWAAQTRDALRRHGVEHRAEVRLAPLADVGLDGHSTPWYSPGATADLRDIGLLFVDGPPGVTGPAARYPAVPMLRDRLAPRAVVVLDDARRRDEQQTLLAWRDELPDFELSRIALQKGAGVFRRGA